MHLSSNCISAVSYLAQIATKRMSSEINIRDWIVMSLTKLSNKEKKKSKLLLIYIDLIKKKLT